MSLEAVVALVGLSGCKLGVPIHLPVRTVTGLCHVLCVLPLCGAPVWVACARESLQRHALAGLVSVGCTQDVRLVWIEVSGSSRSAVHIERSQQPVPGAISMVNMTLA